MQKVVISKTDDIDGTGKAETIPFGIDGYTYEIDLSESNANGIRSLLSPYIAVARQIGGNKSRRYRPSKSRSKSLAMREWAIANGYTLKTRGRIPEHIAREYNQSLETSAPKPVSPSKEPVNDAGTDKPAPEELTVQTITEPRKTAEEIAAGIVTDTLAKSQPNPSPKEVRK